MRLAPVAIFAGGDAAKAERFSDLQSRTTQPAPVAHDSCRLFAGLITEAMTGADRSEVLRPREWTGSRKIAAIAAGTWRGKARAEIPPSGYVVLRREQQGLSSADRGPHPARLRRPQSKRRPAAAFGV